MLTLAEREAIRQRVQGDVYMITPSRWKRLAPDTGHYTGIADAEDSDLECPYCRVPMRRVTKRYDTPHRIAAIVKRGKVKWTVRGHVIPESHDIFACLPCQVEFTSPKDFRAALPAAEEG